MSSGNPSCSPGPNWGKGGGSSGTRGPSAAEIYQEQYRQRQAAQRQRQRQTQAEEEAEQQEEEQAARDRQQQLENQDQQEKAADLKRQQQFERDRRDLLGNIRSINENELGNRNLQLIDPVVVGSSGGQQNPAANAQDCNWGDGRSRTVDLRCLGLDPDKPIVVDPHVVRGQERVFPAQIDPATFQNANYNKGFEELMHFDVDSAQRAVEYFKQARLERPNDPLVRNALLLAQDILKGRQQKEQEDKGRAEQMLYHGVAALLMGDPITANDSLSRALKMDPKNPDIGNWSRLTWGLAEQYKEAGSSPEKKHVCRLIGNGLILESRGDIRTEIVALKEAARLAPDDTYVKTMLWRAQHLQTGNPSLNNVAPPAN